MKFSEALANYLDARDRTKAVLGNRWYEPTALKVQQEAAEQLDVTFAKITDKLVWAGVGPTLVTTQKAPAKRRGN